MKNTHTLLVLLIALSAQRGGWWVGGCALVVVPDGDPSPPGHRTLERRASVIIPPLFLFLLASYQEIPGSAFKLIHRSLCVCIFFFRDEERGWLLGDFAASPESSRVFCFVSLVRPLIGGN